MIPKISLKTARELYGVVERAIMSHKSVGLSDRTDFWDDIPSKQMGVLCFDSFLANENYIAEERREVEELARYWDKNYDAIVRGLFSGEGSMFYRGDSMGSVPEMV